MEAKASSKNIILLTSASLLVTWFLGVMGGPFVRVLRKVMGSLPFWGLGLTFSFLLGYFASPWMAILTASLWVAVGLSTELEQRGTRWGVAALIGLATGFVVGIYGLFLFFTHNGLTDIAMVESFLQKQIPEVYLLLKANQVSGKQALLHLPSSLFIILLLGLSLSQMFERTIVRWFEIPKVTSPTQYLRLLQFTVPDKFIWIMLTSMTVRVLDVPNEGINVVASNIVNIGIVLYLFQGLAVSEVVLKYLKVPNVLRLILYILTITQAFLVFSVLGFADFWLNFRARLSSRPGVSIQDKGGMS